MLGSTGTPHETKGYGPPCSVTGSIPYRYLVCFVIAPSITYNVMADLKPILAKLGRAKTHAQRFDEVAQEIFNRRPFELVGGEEEDGFAIRWKQNGEYPDFEPLSLIFGDMLYNLRATFDYLAWQLVLLNGEEPSRDTSFPCVRKSENWDNNTVKKQLKGIPPRWVDEIKQLQPFDARYTGAPETHPLAVLDEANNVNKHRMLPIALVTPRRVAYEISGVPPGVTKQSIWPGNGCRMVHCILA
jgi:hypothetical protein